MKRRIIRFLALGIWVLSATHCTSIPTSVLLDIRPGVGLPEIGALGITIFNAEGIAVPSRQIPEAKKAELPSTVVLFPDRDQG
ncbi:MAG: hypothetical protein KAI47_05325, partial [Deltaproteobacteria bacterium]|nr:hypothetical protein [Deltaproteobacteria bacterium]